MGTMYVTKTAAGKYGQGSRSPVNAALPIGSVTVTTTNSSAAVALVANIGEVVVFNPKDADVVLGVKVGAAASADDAHWYVAAGEKFPVEAVDNDTRFAVKTV